MRLLPINTQRRVDRGRDVFHVDRPLGVPSGVDHFASRVSSVLPMMCPPFTPPPANSDRKRVLIVVAAVQSVDLTRCAAELTHADHHSFLEQRRGRSARLRVPDPRSRMPRPHRMPPNGPMILPVVDVLVVVPAVLLKEDEARAGIRFDQVARDDARIAGNVLAVPVAFRRVDLEHLRSARIRHQTDGAFVVVVVVAKRLGRQ